MTLEEIIKKGNEKYPQDIIEIINDDGSITREDVNFKVRKAYIQGLIDNNVSLPSDLDEAAEEAGLEYAPIESGEALDLSGQFYETDDVNWSSRHGFLTGFKAGAEWHARKGQTFESVVWKDSEDGLYVEAFVDENKFKMADNVVIQVIKKN